MSGRFQQRLSLADFWDSVDQSDRFGCWPWMGYINPSGYGDFGKFGPAHRVAYELTNGTIPKGKLIRHTCDNRPCCNPRHLVLGTYLDNLNDARERGRWKPRPKLTHCKRGHEFTPKNTYIREYLQKGVPYQFRYCRKCRAEEQANSKRSRRKLPKN